MNVSNARFRSAENDAKASCDEGSGEVLIISTAELGIV